MEHKEAIAVVGATGHTGRFVVNEISRLGMRVIRIGRDQAKLNADAGAFPEDEARCATIDDARSLDVALRGASAVINCAGPFLDTGLQVLDAALRASIPYVDVAAEQAAVKAMFDTRHALATAAGVPVVPAMAFYGGLADLMASAVIEENETVDEIEIAIGLDSWHPTLGTRLTGKRNNVPRVVLQGGRLELLASPPHRSYWNFPEPIGRREVVAQPFTEVVTLASHLRVDTITPWLNVEPLQDLRDAATPPPTSNHHTGRSDQQFVMDVLVRKRGQLRMVRAQGRDIYYVTAPMAVQAAMRLISGDARYRHGVHSAGAMFDPRSFLQGLALAGLDVSFDGNTLSKLPSIERVGA